MMPREKTTREQRETIIAEYMEGYISDGFDRDEARIMATADFDCEYEVI